MSIARQGRTIGVSGVWLGLICGGWSLIMGVTGWYKSPTFVNLMLLTIPLQLVALGFLLRRTAKAGLRFSEQLVAGIAITAIGAALSVLASFLVTRVLIPTYHQDQQALHRAALEQQGMDPAAIAAALAAHRPPGPLEDARGEFMVRLVVGVVGSAAVGSVVRARRPPPTC